MGWTTRLFTMAEGCHGFPAQSVQSLLRKVGARGRDLPDGWGRRQKEASVGSGTREKTISGSLEEVQ